MSARPDLQSLSKELKRPISTLLVLAPHNDPFYAGCQPSSERDANWFAELYRAHGFRQGVHLRRIHYVLISHPTKMANGAPYQNTLECWQLLIAASKPARYLDLVKIDDFDDKRAPPPRLYLPQPVEPPAVVAYSGDDLDVLIPDTLPDLPSLAISANVPHAYHVELWAEKSTVDDVLDPIGRNMGVNVVTGVGEMSISACRDLVRRALANGGRPVRIGYISDFDPAGQSMPVATARKIEFFVRTHAPELDIQVDPIALTFDQCIEFELPRTPIKESERRAERFEQRFGAGATELDALEALHPGELRKIILAFVNRYRDTTFHWRWMDAKEAHTLLLKDIEGSVIEDYAGRIVGLEARLGFLRETANAQAAALRRDIAELYSEIESDMARRADDVAVDMPEPEPADELANPLFDSRRTYVEQIDRFKAHQGRPTARRSKKRGCA